jgi:hypothetical protein
MARPIFCFFAESTGIFLPRLFTETVRQMSESWSGNTHEVIAELFRAMDTKIEDRKAAKFRPWAEAFPYVNGGLSTGNADSPRFSRIARSYLLRRQSSPPRTCRLGPVERLTRHLRRHQQGAGRSRLDACAAALR